MKYQYWADMTACIIASMTRSGILESRPAWWSEVLIGYLKVLSVPCLISPKCENLFLSSDVTFSQCHPQTLTMKTFAEVKTSWKWRTGQEVLITSTYNFSSTPNCSHIRPQYDYSSILCHIHWVCTQEAAQTSSSLQDIYCLFLYTSCTTTWHASNRWAEIEVCTLWWQHSQTCVERGLRSSLLAALI